MHVLKVQRVFVNSDCGLVFGCSWCSRRSTETARCYPENRCIAKVKSDPATGKAQIKVSQESIRNTNCSFSSKLGLSNCITKFITNQIHYYSESLILNNVPNINQKIYFQRHLSCHLTAKSTTT